LLSPELEQRGALKIPDDGEARALLEARDHAGERPRRRGGAAAEEQRRGERERDGSVGADGAGSCEQGLGAEQRRALVF
jgi:hypothetical protein